MGGIIKNRPSQTSSVQVRYRCTGVPKHPSLRLGLDWQLPGVAKCPPGPHSLLCWCPREWWPNLHPEYLLYVFCIGAGRRHAAPRWWLPPRRRLGAGRGEVMFSPQLHFCFSAGKHPSSPQLLPPVILEELCLPLCRSKIYFAFHQLSMSMGFVFCKVIKCKIRPLCGLPSFSSLKFIISLVRLLTSHLLSN